MIMSEQENNVFRVGDVVTLKLDPEFRAVIQYFCRDMGNGFTFESAQWIEKENVSLSAHLSFFDSDNKIQTRTIPIFHLKALPESNL
jgi:hypothetical protein